MRKDLSEEGRKILLDSLHFSITVLAVKNSIKQQISLLLKDHRMRRSSKLEMPDFLTLPHLLSNVNRTHTARTLCHSDVNNRHFSYMLVFRIYHHNFSCCHCTQKRFAVVWGALIIRNKLRLIEIIASRNSVDVLNDSIDRRMPPVVEKSTQKCLINCSTHKMIHQMMPIKSICGKHIAQGIYVVLQPKIISFLYVSLRLQGRSQRSGFTRIHNNVVIINPVRRACPHRPFSRLENSQKPFVPIFESIMRLLREANVLIIVNLFLCLWTEPSVRGIIIHMLQRGRRKQHFLVSFKNFLEMVVDTMV